MRYIVLSEGQTTIDGIRDVLIEYLHPTKKLLLLLLLLLMGVQRKIFKLVDI